MIKNREDYTKEEMSSKKILFPIPDFGRNKVLSKKNEYQGHLIREVYPDSIAEAMEIAPGDVLLR